MPEHVIIDTDPGIDDAMAILFALASPELELLGLSAIYGNVHTPLATANALRLLEFAGREDIPVVAGVEAPLIYPLDRVAEAVHGRDGFGNVSLPEAIARPAAEDAVDFMAEQVLARPGKITIAALGPLTNLAVMAERYPAAVSALKQVVLMGGAVQSAGNITPYAEANIHHDPHAAARVFNAGWRVVMLGLDVTHQTIMSGAYFDSLKRSRTGELIHRMSRFYTDFYKRSTGIDGAYTHDPSVAAYLIDDTIFRTRSGRIEVDLDGLYRGRTRFTPDEDGAVEVATGVKSEGLLRIFRERILNQP